MYIVIETFDREYPSICTDQNGYPLVFTSKDEADDEAYNCQAGIVVEF